ncbi:hypothetical protein [Mesorhizobium sp. M0037]|uniref:hypothetical protein n=1 Tax=unclassified Mesorhizobium TaxID=325217 RepID=UPI00333E059F
MSARKPNPYQERCRIHVLEWAKGNAYHEPINDECCPDGSCCNPELFEKDAAKRWQQYHEMYGREN